MISRSSAGGTRRPESEVSTTIARQTNKLNSGKYGRQKMRVFQFALQVWYLSVHEAEALTNARA